MRTLLKLLAFIIGSAVVARLGAFVVARQLDVGTEVSDELRRVVVFDGLDFTSRARGLRRAEVSVFLGGAKVDLRHAVIDPAGARVRVQNTLGGLVVTVRDDWAVTVHEALVGGGDLEVKVTPPQDLPEDAPRLEIDVMTRLGGTVITTENVDL